MSESKESASIMPIMNDAHTFVAQERVAVLETQASSGLENDLIAILQGAHYGVIHLACDRPFIPAVLPPIAPDLLILSSGEADPQAIQDLCRQLKDDPHTRPIPILLIGPFQTPTAQQQAFESGGDDYVSTPFSPETVLHRIARLLTVQRLAKSGSLTGGLASASASVQPAASNGAIAHTQNAFVWRSLLDVAPDVIFYKDVNGVYQICNRAFQELTGKPQQALLGQTALDLFSHSTAQRLHQQDVNVIQELAPKSIEEWAEYPDGRRRLLDILKAPYHDNQGNLQGIIGICRDITDRKQTEEQLQTITSRLVSLVEHLQTGIVLEDENLQIVLINSSFCDLFPIPGGCVSLVGQSGQRLIEQCQPCFLHAQWFLQSTQEAIAHKDLILGEEWVLRDGKILERDYIPIWVEQTYQGHVWQYRDVTIHRSAQLELHRHLEQIVLLQQITEAIRSQLSPEDIFNTTVALIARAFGVNRCLIHDYVKDPYERIPIVAECVDAVFPAMMGTAEILVEGNLYAQQVLSQNRAIASSNVDEDPFLRPVAALCHQLSIRSMLSIRTSYQGQPNGLIGLHQCDRTRTWTLEEVNLLEAIADQVGIALAQAKLLQQEQHQRQLLDEQVLLLQHEVQQRQDAETNLRKTLETLARFSSSLKQLHRLNLQDYSSLEDLFQDYLQTGCDLFGFTSGAIGQIDGSVYRFLGVESNLEVLQCGLELPLSSTYCGLVFRKQATLSFRHAGADATLSQHPLYQSMQLESYMGTPIWIDGRIFGTLCFFSENPHCSLIEHYELEILELMAQAIGKFIQKTQIEKQRYAAEQELRRSEERWQLAIQGSNDGIFDVDLQAHQSFFSNRYWEMLGYSAEEVTTNNEEWLSRIHPDDYDRVMQTNHAYLNRQLLSYAIEYRLRRKDGQYIWVLSRGKALWDDQGNPLRLIGFTGDISDRKRSEAAIITQSQELTHFSNSLQQLHRLSMTDFQTLDDLLADYLKTGCQILEFPVGIISSLCDRQFVIEAAQPNLPPFLPKTQIPIRDLYCAAVLQHCETISYVQVGQDPHVSNHSLYRKWKFESYLGTPIFVNGDVYGTLSFFGITPREQDFKHHEIEIIELMAQSIGKFISAHRIELKRQAIETELRVSEERWQLAIRGTNDGIFDMNLQTGTVFYSVRWKEMLGYEDHEIQTSPDEWLNRIHPDDFGRVMAAQQAHLAGRTPSFVEEYRIQCKDGSYKWVLGRAQAVWSDLGHLVRFLGAHTDISHRKEVEVVQREIIERERATLRLIERMRQTLDIRQIFQVTTEDLRRLLRCDRVLVYRFNPDWSGAIVEESTAEGVFSILQVQNPPLTQEQQLIEGDRCVVQAWKTAENTWSGEESLLIQDSYLQETGGGVYAKGEKFLAVSDIHAGSFAQCYVDLLRNLHVRAYLTVPIFHGKRLWGLLASYQNDAPRIWKSSEIGLAIHIGTQLGVALQQAELLAQSKQQSIELEKARDTAEKANRAKSEFLANMSHELRTPLNAILGFTQVMTRDLSLNPDHQNYLSIINNSGQHLLKLINDVLEMSKIEAGYIELNTVSFDLYRLLTDLEELFRLRASAKQLTFTIEIDPTVPQYITTDENKLRQVLINLLSNAIKFTQVGSVQLQVQSEPPNEALSAPSLQNPMVLYFNVTDTGPGIAQHELDRLFRPFEQTAIGQQVHGGTGLGLAISSKFIQLMEGNIKVCSQVGRGTSFQFTIQVWPSNSASIPERPTHKTVIGLAAVTSQYRLLIAEDQWENRQFLAKLLTMVGFIVQEAENGQEAIRIWQEWKPDVILMDMQMPLMNGYQATQQIKSTIEGQSTVIIATTSSAFEENRMAILSAGCDDFIRKPIQQDVLFSKLAEHLKIEYIYQDNREIIVPDNVEQCSTLNRANLSLMSKEWIGQLHYAARGCSDRQVLELVQQIPSRHSTLADILTNLVYDFRFEEIVEATRPLHEEN
jgi:two-component system sensor histidine kinase/response regulator